MRTLLSLILVLLVGVVALLAIQTFNHPREVWQYGVLAPKDEELIQQLDKAGAEGWELISARRAASGEGPNAKMSYEMLMKRHGEAQIAPLPASLPGK